MPIQTRKLLALGTFEKWPEPLHGMLAGGYVSIESVATLHEAAATLALQPSRFQAFLINIQHLGHRELSMLVLFRRHLSVPLWLLPPSDQRTHAPWVRACGALSWEEAKLALELIRLQKVPTGDYGRGSKESLQISRSLENSPPAYPKISHGGNMGEGAHAAHPSGPVQPQPSVGSGVVTGYHKKHDPSSLSDDEIRALLGPVD